MTRLFLAAGVAALAIAAPAAAKPGGGGNEKGEKAAVVKQGGGGAAAQRQQARAERQQARPQRIERQQVRMERQARPQRIERQQARVERQARPQRIERQQVRAERHARPQRIERQQVRVERQARPQRIERQQVRVERQARPQRIERQQVRAAERQQMRIDRRQQIDNRIVERQQVRDNRVAVRQQMRDNRVAIVQNGRGFGAGGCPPGLDKKPGCLPPGIAKQETLQALQRANDQVFRASAIQMLTPRTRIIAPTQALTYIGAPLATVASAVPLMALPQSVSYLYPDTDDYYYRYGNGYLYQVDRGSSLIEALIPLLAGGFLPGTYLPAQYMNSYVPNYYGLSSFYPSSYAYNGYGYNQGYGYNAGYGYGYNYNNLCNRYANGVIYQVDCYTGLVQNVVPMYAGGYGVGQILPSAYSYYNVPTQYRSLYYPTNDYSYWYAPGAIYQYDPSSSLITSVAALLSPGFTIGQPLPAGYGMYNVPLAYRSTYYDTPNAWYRYNNGYIYQVDPTTQLVTAIVASLLT